MNPHEPAPTDPPDDPAIAELVGDALAADASPADLEARVLALTDPSLNALLDEVLVADELPAGLHDRVLAATRGALEEADTTPPVLARIGLPALRYAAAAAVIAAAGLGVYVATQSQPGTPSDRSVVVAPDPTGSDQENDYPDFAEVDLEGSFAIDDEIEQLDSRITGIDEGLWSGEIDDFEAQLWSELSGEGSL
ncbi:MAG: hypothetical protein AAGC44_10160 [Planctomycetota bacterium]